LRKLDLSTNRLQSLDGIGSLTALQVLLVAHNKIESLKGLKEVSREIM
jgi:Leucine-rich repeat (LRR) protein